MILESFQINNFRNIKNEIINAENINLIHGDNAQGKTSINKALLFLLTGTKKDIVQLKKDETEGFVKATLLNKDGSIVIIKKTIKPPKKKDGEYRVLLNVQSEGKLVENAVEFVKNEIGIINFNFAETLSSKKLLEKIDTKVLESDIELLDNKDLIETEFKKIKHLSGFEVTELLTKTLYDTRTINNRELTTLKKYNEERETELTLRTRELKTVMFDKEKFESNQKEMQLLDAKLVNNKDNLSQSNNKILELKETAELHQFKTEKLEKELQELKNTVEKAKEAYAIHKEKYNEVKDDMQSLSEIESKIDKNNLALEKLENSRKENILCEAFKIDKKALEEKQTKAKGLEDYSDSLGRDIEICRKVINNYLIERYKLDIKGLVFSDGIFYLNGVQIEELSESESVRLGFKIIERMGDDKSIVLFDGAEVLDDSSYKELKSYLVKGKAYFITKVGDPFKTVKNEQVMKMVAGEVK